MDRSQDRAVALGRQLVEVHDWLREQLAELRDPGPGAGRPDLRAHCLAFCSALGRHHRDEDDGVFPALGAIVAVPSGPRPVDLRAVLPRASLMEGRGGRPYHGSGDNPTGKG